jgi:GNAT superfamily N-acetyltransferase
MVLELPKGWKSPAVEDLRVIAAKSRDEAFLWSQIASEAFGYSVGAAVVENAIGSPGVTFYLGFRGGEVAGTGLLCTHEGMAGLHMAGTRPQHRRKGIARQMMHHLLREAAAGRFRYATLQASAMGEPLYTQLGFAKQFVLHNYLFRGE